ncbi:hypothetical protein JZ751_017692 [Albula glossodonta]|uniref:OTU domain-containing protein 3 n=1 Tax=Albula glossodonta TaxID=121402 RepID=A0A8T2PP42_9TELE|nr:hypothetical protein JZ751_017692 [Albula glossodonta]
MPMSRKLSAKLAQGNRKSDVENQRNEQEAHRALANDWKNHPQREELVEEFANLNDQLEALGLKLREVPGDGNCLFRALGDQLEGHSRGHLQLRQETVQYMQAHRQDFEPFVEDDIPFTDYLLNLSQPGTFAGNDAIVAFARSHQLRVIIHQLNTSLWEINGSEKPVSHELHIAYRYGDHYDSVRPIGDNSECPAQLRLENLNRSKGQHESQQPGGRQRYRLNTSPATNSDDEEPITTLLVSKNPSGQGKCSKQLRATKPHCHAEGEGSEVPAVSYCTLWGESGTGTRLFGPVTPTKYSELAATCDSNRTKAGNNQRKDQQGQEKKRRQEERHRPKVQQSRAPQDQNQSETVTLVPAFNTLSI